MLNEWTVAITTYALFAKVNLCSTLRPEVSIFYVITCKFISHLRIGNRASL